MAKKWQSNTIKMNLDEDFTEDVDVQNLATEQSDLKGQPIVLTGAPSNIKLVMKDKQKKMQENTTPVASEVKPAVSIQSSVTLGMSSTIPTLTERTYTPKTKAWSDIKMAGSTNTNNININIEPKNNTNFTNKSRQSASGLIYPAGIPRSFIDQNPHLYSMGPNQYQQNHQGFSQHEARQSPNVGTDSTNEMQLYSPEDASEYDEDAASQDSESQSGKKRVSAFHRLGPVSEPKKPKLTINLLFSKEQAVREVVDNEVEKPVYVPVHEREDIITSTDPIVIKFLSAWPWKKEVPIVKTAAYRNSKTVMLLEKEQMQAAYLNDSNFFQVTIKDYPETMGMLEVLDAFLYNTKDRLFIPCFIDFSPQECKFLCIRSASALNHIHNKNMLITHDNMQYPVIISETKLNLDELRFLPKLVLKKILALGTYNDTHVDLSEFCLKTDLRHFIYFPLNIKFNQTEITTHIKSNICWDIVVELNLSKNRMTSITGFNLVRNTPRLKRLDLSHNLLSSIKDLLPIKYLHLTSLKLEGNPLCSNYIDPESYVESATLIFPTLKELDEIKLPRFGEIPPVKQNFCLPFANDVAEKFLEVFFPLLDLQPDDRTLISNIYDHDAVLTVTYNHKMKFLPEFRYVRNFFAKGRVLSEGIMDAVEGSAAIVKYLLRWPKIIHDPYTFVTDVMFHSDKTTILRISGLVKVTAETLAVDEPLLQFTRTVVLVTNNDMEYRVKNEMLYWTVPTKECALKSFQVMSVTPNKLCLKFDSPPQGSLREGLLEVFARITKLSKSQSEKCLELKHWDFRSAIEYYIQLLKLNSECTLDTKE